MRSSPAFYTRSSTPELYYWKTATTAGGPVPAREILVLEIDPTLQVCPVGQTTWHAPASLIPPPAESVSYWRCGKHTGGPNTIAAIWPHQDGHPPISVLRFRSPGAQWEPLANHPRPPAPPPVPVVHDPGAGWQAFGVIAIVIGVLGTIHALNQDTSAPGTDVTNLSRQHNQLVHLILWIALLVTGLLSLLLRPRKL